MLLDFLLDETGDLALEGGNALGVSGLQALAQLARIRLGTGKGEWSPDTRQGMPYLETILKRGVPLSDVETVFRKGLLLCPGFLSVETLTVSRVSERGLLVAFRAKTVEGELNSEDFPPFVVTTSPE